MKQTKNKRYQETYVEETLDNGLHVVLWHKPDFEKSLFLMATPLGAMDMEQVDEDGETYNFPAGIAHFLEHKMFEMEGCDVMERFSQLSANVNAFTSYDETAYYFSTTADVKAPLELLLDFVQTLSISEESVEKEKGIIVQELSMYKQMSDNRLLMETFSSLYKEHPLRFDIGGDDESVNSITLQQLQECYEMNYHPSNMILVGVSRHDPSQLLEIIRNNQQQKRFAPMKKIATKSFDEPAHVEREEFSFKMDVSIPKVSIAYKLTGIQDVYDRTRCEWCVKILLDAYFSSLCPDYQTWMDEGIINDYVGSEVDFGEDYGMLMFYAETQEQERFAQVVSTIIQRMTSGRIDEELLTQLKRRYFGQTVRSLNSFDDIAITYARSYFDQVDFFKIIDVLDAITLQDVQQFASMLDFTESCVVTLEPEENK